MPMKFGAVDIESPQEVLARLRNERVAMASSGNPAAINQATFQNGLDAIFGNPEVKNAVALTNRLKQAQANTPAQEGDDDVTSEMRRIAAMRDAVSDIHPELANQLTTQLLQLGNVKAERQKLQAQTALAADKNAREAGKDQRDAIKFGFDTAAKAQGIEAAAGAGTNYWKRVGNQIKHIAVPDSDSLQRRALMGQGWIEGTGPTSEAEAGAIVNPTKPVMTDLQTAYNQSQEQLNGMASIAQKFDPSFLTLPTQILNGGRAFLEKTGIKLPAEQAAKLDQYTEFKRNSVDSFNRYIKFITGAQMAVQEAARIQKGFPDADKDGPTQFVGKMRETARAIMGVQRRSAQAIKNGLQITPEQAKTCADGTGPCVWDSIQVPSVSDSEVDQFLSRYGIPPRSGKTSNGPDANGFVTTRSGAKVKEIK